MDDEITLAVRNFEQESTGVQRGAINIVLEAKYEIGRSRDEGRVGQIGGIVGIIELSN